MALLKINSIIVFDTVNREIYSTQRVTVKKRLGLAAAYSLEALILAKGETVTLEELINNGWRKHGLEVSSSNVRQVISQIRRVFVSLKLSPDLLVTVPKQGYRLHITEPNIYIDEQEDLSLPTSLEDKKPAEVCITEEEQQVDESSTSRKSKYEFFSWRMITLILITNACITLWVVSSSSVLSKNTLQYFLFAKDEEFNLKIYTNASIANSTPYVETAMSKLKDSPLWKNDEKKYKWVYINSSDNEHLYSYFLCNSPIESRTSQCASRIIIDK